MVVNTATTGTYERQAPGFAATMMEVPPRPKRPAVYHEGTHSAPDLEGFEEERPQPDTDSAYQPLREVSEVALAREGLILKDVGKPSPEFAEFTIRRNVKIMSSLLGKLRANLDNPEGAAIMVSFREKLSAAWKVKDSLPEERVFLLSAVDEVVREKKWRELTPGQVDVLSDILNSISDRALLAKRMVAAFKAIHKSGIDIYPSSLISEEDEEEND